MDALYADIKATAVFSGDGTALILQQYYYNITSPRSRNFTVP